jgi:hypothetical protein
LCYEQVSDFSLSLPQTVLKHNIMETKTTKNTSKKRKKKKTPEEKRAIMATIVPQNRSMKAFIEHQGEVWVKDPMLLL